MSMFEPSVELPQSLPGFEHIRRAYSAEFDAVVAKILPGEWYVAVSPELITTVLGSCVAACVRDPVSGVGGMNHFMLPAGKSATSSEMLIRNRKSTSFRYGAPAMDVLIQTIVSRGARREDLEVKLFGGGQVLEFEQMQVGDANSEFARDYVRNAGLKLVAEDLGSTFPRRVVFDPVSGRARVRRLRRSQATTVSRQEREYCTGR